MSQFLSQIRNAYFWQQPRPFQLLEYQMCCGGGLIWYSREIGLCPPCTWDTPHIWGDPISAVEKRRKRGGEFPPLKWDKIPFQGWKNGGRLAESFHHWNGIKSHFRGGKTAEGYIIAWCKKKIWIWGLIFGYVFRLGKTRLHEFFQIYRPINFSGPPIWSAQGDIHGEIPQNRLLAITFDWSVLGTSG